MQINQDDLLGAAVASLRPGTQWVLSGTDVQQIEWLSEDVEPLTTAEVQDEIVKIKKNRQWQELRYKRNAMLAACDWTQVADSPVDASAWAAYRQQLRDLPSTTFDPSNPAWPIEP